MSDYLEKRLKQIVHLILDIVDPKLSKNESEISFGKGGGEKSAAIICRIFSHQNKILKSFGSYTPIPRMLLELYLASSRLKNTSVTDVASMCEIPATTALRYIDLLEKTGLLYRKADPCDKRRFWLILTANGVNVVEDMLSAFNNDLVSAIID